MIEFVRQATNQQNEIRLLVRSEIVITFFLSSLDNHFPIYMSKKKQKPTKKNEAVAKTRAKKNVSKQNSSSPKSYLIRDSVTTVQDPFYEKLFKGISIGMLVMMLFLSLGSGINGDDEFQNDYSTKLVNYYSSMGQDTSALYIEKGNMHLYGGFFDLVTGSVNSMFGYTLNDAGYHNIRHLFNALLGFIAIFFTALLSKEIAGWRAAILTLIFMFLSPRFLGHSFMNPKDIPFAAGFIIAIYYMVIMLKNMPKPSWKTLLGLALGIALAISSRAGGLLLFAYLGLFAGIDFIMKHGIRGIANEGKTTLKYAGYVLGVALTGFVLAILFWPFALVNPIDHPLEALTEFEKLGIKIRLLFQGENVMSDETAWHYPLQWIWRTIPLFVLVGFAGSVVLLKKLWKRYHILPILLCFFAAIFPVAYVIYKGSIIHDGWRHLMFIYPTMVVLAALFWVNLEDILKNNQIGKYAIYGIVGIMCLESGIYIAKNIKYPYTYFNAASGGVNGAFGNYETDYWGTSMKQGLQWMEKEGILKEGMQDTIVIATSFIHNLKTYVGNKYKGNVRPIYVRFNQRYDKNWDYGLFPSRYIRGPHLRKGTWPNSKNIHAITANGVPILSIEKRSENFLVDGEKAFKAKDYEKAINEFNKEVQQYPDNEIAWLKLAMCFSSLRQYPQVETAANKALEIAPDNVNALYYRAVAKLQTGKEQEALNDFNRTVEVNKQFSTGYYYRAVILAERKQYQDALESAIEAIKTNPKFSAAYDLAARIYESVGDTERARQILQMKQ